MIATHLRFALTSISLLIAPLSAPGQPLASFVTPPLPNTEVADKENRERPDWLTSSPLIADPDSYAPADAVTRPLPWRIIQGVRFDVTALPGDGRQELGLTD